MIFFNTKYKQPEIGDFKIKKRFAFWPKAIRDKIVWLEFYEEIFFFSETEIAIKNGAIIKFKSWIKTDIRCQNKITK